MGGGRRKILLMIMLGSAVVFQGCAQGAEGDGETAAQETFRANEPFSVEETANENIAGIVQETAAGVMVQVNAGGLLGSGVILSMNEEELVIVTALHVVEQASEVSLLFTDGSSAQSGDIRRSDAADAAFICLPAASLSRETLATCRDASVNKERFDAMQNGDIIVVMGSKDGAAANAYEGELVQPWIYMEDFGQYMMLCRTYAFAGMSGGGVFDGQGHFIGILCGGNEDDEIAVLPLSILLTEYEQKFTEKLDL